MPRDFADGWPALFQVLVDAVRQQTIIWAHIGRDLSRYGVASLGHNDSAIDENMVIERFFPTNLSINNY